VLLLEAGPDYGPLRSEQWPERLLDPTLMPVEEASWAYTSVCRHGTPDMALQRARVIGGCSSHNGCAAIWGARADYDQWAAEGNEGWSTDELLPFFRRSNERMRVAPTPHADLTPYQKAAMDALIAMGIPATDDLNDLDEPQGVSPSPVNVDAGVRFNTAFAYLDPVRHKPNLTIVGEALADRVLVEGSRIVGAEAIDDGRREQVRAGRTIVCGGAYGSPAILERSGIGDPLVLEPLGIRVVPGLEGVGANLHDHPAVDLFFTGTDELIRQMRARAEQGFCPEEQVIA
jgi:choline dehydrogenase